MRTVTLIGTHLSSSRLGFGLSGLHHHFRSRDRQNLLSHAVNDGITYFDTSPYYGHGLAERELGVFANRRRHQILIATKIGIQANPWLNRFPTLMYSRLVANMALRRLTRRKQFVIANRLDYSAPNAVASLDQSLRSLRTDHVDILYIHDPTLTRLREPERLFDTLRSFQTSGKVRYFGLAGNGADCTAILRRHPTLRCLLQIDAAAGNEELERLNSASIPFHSSYGHFRAQAESIPFALGSAAAANRNGVILFSTRRSERIGAMIRLLTSLETA